MSPKREPSALRLLPPHASLTTTTLRSVLWTTPVLESRDKMLLVPRLARLWSGLPDAGRRAAIEGCAAHLPKMYELLAKMDSFAFPFNLQATLAADLVSEPGFDSGDEGQMDALAQGLGLNTPGPEWTAVGTGTSSLQPEVRKGAARRGVALYVSWTFFNTANRHRTRSPSSLTSCRGAGMAG